MKINLKGGLIMFTLLFGVFACGLSIYWLNIGITCIINGIYKIVDKTVNKIEK